MPELLDLFPALPKAGSQSGYIDGPVHCHVHVFGALNVVREEIAHELSYKVIGTDAAIDANALDSEVDFAPSDIVDLLDRVGERFEQRPDNVLLSCAVCDSHYRAGGKRVIVRCLNAVKRWHKAYTGRIRDRQSQGLRFGWFLVQSELCSPLDHTAAAGAVGLGQEDQILANLPPDDRVEPGKRGVGLAPCVDAKEHACSQSALEVARPPAALSKGGARLVRDDARNGNRSSEQVLLRVPKLTTAVLHLGHDGGRYAEQVQHRAAVVQLVGVVERRRRNVGVIRRVDFAFRQLPQEPGVDGAKADLAVPGHLIGTLDVVEGPVESWCGLLCDELDDAGSQKALTAREEVQEPGTRVQKLELHRFVPVLADLSGAAVLPRDDVTQGLARSAVPQEE